MLLFHQLPRPTGFKQKVSLLVKRSFQDYKILEANTLPNLIHDLKNSLARVKVEKDVNVREVLNLLRYYQPNESEWSQYAFHDNSQSYTRNLISQVTPNARLLLLVWDPLKSSSIHDHPKSNCFMKILKGSIAEKLYFQKEDQDVELIRNTTLPLNSVAYINDKMGVHSMKNESNEQVVSMHLYVPSYEKSTSFKAGTKGGIVTPMEFYSIGGKVVQ